MNQKNLRGWSVLMGLLALLNAGCGLKIKHKIEGGADAKVQVALPFENLIQQLAAGQKADSGETKKSVNSIQNSINQVLGPTGSSPLPAVGALQDSMPIYLADGPEHRLLVIDQSDPTFQMILDLATLTLFTDSGEFKMIRSFSSDLSFNWWFQKDNLTINLWVQANASSNRFEGTLNLYQK